MCLSAIFPLFPEERSDLTFLDLAKEINSKFAVLSKEKCCSLNRRCFLCWFHNKFLTHQREGYTRMINDNVFFPTFDSKVTEYLCSGWVFFSDKFRLFN